MVKENIEKISWQISMNYLLYVEFNLISGHHFAHQKYNIGDLAFLSI